MKKTTGKRTKLSPHRYSQQIPKVKMKDKINVE